MSFVKPSSIQLLAESLAVPKLSSDSAKALAPHVDVRLREIVQARFRSLAGSASQLSVLAFREACLGVSVNQPY